MSDRIIFGHFPYHLFVDLFKFVSRLIAGPLFFNIIKDYLLTKINHYILFLSIIIKYIYNPMMMM